MDIGNINNTVVGKRLIEDARKIQKQICNDNVQLIKHQVNQDSSFWYLKEKLEQKKSDHERLQQNIVDLQMQYETLSGQYQQELRHRPETMNKLDATRKLCSELERLVMGSKQMYATTKADQAALYDAYMKADEMVQRLKQEHLRMKETAKNSIRELESQLKQVCEQHKQTTGVYLECQQRSASEMRQLRDQLQAAHSAQQQLLTETSDSRTALAAANTELNKREAAITNLQSDMKNTLINMNSQLAEVKKNSINMDQLLKTANEEIESLKKALRNQEEFTKMQCDRNSELQEKLAVIEEEYQKSMAANDDYKIKLEETTSKCQELNNTIGILKEKLNYNQETLSICEGELKSQSEILLQYHTEIEKLTLQLNNCTEESKNDHIIIESLKAENTTLQKNICEIDATFKNYREAAEEKIIKQAATIDEIKNELETKTSTITENREQITKLEEVLQKQAETLQEINIELESKNVAVIQANAEIQSVKEERDKISLEQQKLTKMIEEIDKELKLKTSAITQGKEERDNLEVVLQKLAANIDKLKQELEEKTSVIAQENERSTKLETELQKLKIDWNDESEVAKNTERKLKAKVLQLETAVRAKDEELSHEMSSFLQKRNELEKDKTALREVINGLEQRIKNIVKEASNARPTPPRLADIDDNAVMPLTPVPGSVLSPFIQRPHQDSLFSFFSEQSAESMGALQRNVYNAPQRAFPLSPQKRARPDTPIREMPATANIFNTKKPTERRFFKSRPSSTVKDKSKKKK